MRSTWRTLTERVGAGTLRDIVMVCVADTLVAASFGAIAVSGGLPAHVPVALSLLVFAGGAQFAAVGVLVAGGSQVAAVAAALLLNTRLLPFGLAVSEVLGRRLHTRLVGAHLVVDESVAFALRHRDPPSRRAAFWICGLALFVCWNLGVGVGAVVGSALRDTDAFGLDAAFPAVLVALVAPALSDRSTRLAALVGVAVALATTPFLPAGVPLLLSLSGMATLLIPGSPVVSGDDPADR